HRPGHRPEGIPQAARGPQPGGASGLSKAGHRLPPFRHRPRAGAGVVRFPARTDAARQTGHPGGIQADPVMSFLAPLFLVGGLAVALPIVFHLIRRTSKEKMTFSSLMFLRPTPPRVTRRNRLENIFLLCLRCLVLCLLALGFARPFLQKPMVADLGNGKSKKILLLVDTSAS